MHPSEISARVDGSGIFAAKSRWLGACWLRACWLGLHWTTMLTSHTLIALSLACCIIELITCRMRLNALGQLLFVPY